MMRDVMMVLVVIVGLTGCARYSTHTGRVGPPQTPSPLSEAQETAVQAVTYGSVPVNRVPELVAPVTRTVWIKGFQRRPGEYVGDYPLTLVYTQADFVQPEPPAVAIPHAIQSGVSTENQPPSPGERQSDPAAVPAATPSTGASQGPSANETLHRYLEQTQRSQATGVPAVPDTAGSMAP